MEGLVKRFMDCVGKDLVLLCYRSGITYHVGSIEAMELCDEIQRLLIARSLMLYGEFRGENEIDRSSIVVEALKFRRDVLESMNESAEILGVAS